jgi:hypothetical protein
MLVFLAFNFPGNLPGPIPENQREVLISTLFCQKEEFYAKTQYL